MLKIKTFLLPRHVSSSLHHRSDKTGLEEVMFSLLFFFLTNFHLVKMTLQRKKKKNKTKKKGTK